MRIPACPCPTRARVPVSLLAAGLATAVAANPGATAQTAVASRLQPAGVTDDDVVPQLPANLKPVPAGTVHLGMTYEELVELIAAADPYADEQRKIRWVRVSGGELGETEVEVDAFLLGKYPVTNREYEKFVKATGHRPPFHWWRFGREDDYKARQEEIAEQFSGDNSAIQYWKARWQELPYALKDKDGQDIGDLPVTFVDRTDALLFAGWAGARLPTEAEWSRAARGGSESRFVWGNHGEDVYVHADKATLEALGLKDWRDAVLKPVGSMGEIATGPFGHGDMVGQVWEWMGDPQGVRPLAGADAWKDEWRSASRTRDKDVRVLFEKAEVDFASTRYIAKGGSYADALNGPFLYHIDTRFPRSDDATFATIGFRIAKSQAPAIDMARSLLVARYATGVLQGNQSPAVERQLGVERYHLDSEGQIERYEAASLVPMNHLLGDNRSRLKDLEERSRSTPVPVAVLVLSGKAVQPALDQSLYTILYRAEGMPDELQIALKDANKDLRKAAKKGEEVDGADPEVIAWRKVLAKYGITEEEAAAEDAAKEMQFVRIPGSAMKIPTDKPALILVDNQERVVEVLPQRKDVKLSRSVDGMVQMGVVEKGEGIAGKQAVNWTIGVPLTPDDRAKLAEFQLELVLDSVPDPNNPWRR